MEANLLITGNCNLRCKHCSVSSHGDLKKDLPLSSWIGILDELEKSKVIKLTVTGGEPLLRQDFGEIVKEIARRPFRFSINTNGTLITDKIIRRFLESTPRLEEIMVSLDGHDRKTVDSQRGEGVFDLLEQGVQNLRASGIPFGFYCTVTALNVMFLNETAELAMKLGARWIKFNNFLYAGPLLGLEVIPENKTVIEAAEKLKSAERLFPGRIIGSLIEMRNRVIALKNGNLPRTDGSAYSCGGGRNKIAVFPDGTVTPCDHLPDFPLGNITEESLENILTGNAMTRFTEFMKQPRQDYSLCKDCDCLPFCTGGCPVEAISSRETIGYDRHSCLKLAIEST